MAQTVKNLPANAELGDYTRWVKKVKNDQTKRAGPAGTVGRVPWLLIGGENHSAVNRIFTLSLHFNTYTLSIWRSTCWEPEMRRFPLNCEVLAIVTFHLPESVSSQIFPPLSWFPSCPEKHFHASQGAVFCQAADTAGGKHL